MNPKHILSPNKTTVYKINEKRKEKKQTDIVLYLPWYCIDRFSYFNFAEYRSSLFITAKLPVFIFLLQSPKIHNSKYCRKPNGVILSGVGKYNVSVRRMVEMNKKSVVSEFLESLKLLLNLFHYRIKFLTHSQNERIAVYPSIIPFSFPLSCSNIAVKMWNLFPQSSREGFQTIWEKKLKRADLGMIACKCLNICFQLPLFYVLWVSG